MNRLGFSFAVAFFATSCSATQQVPIRNPGLWEITLSSESETSQQAVTVQQCTNTLMDAKVLLSIAPAQENCAPAKVQRQGKHYKIENQCAAHGQKVAMKMELSGDFRHSYKGQYQIRYMSRPQEELRSFTAKWISPCHAGMTAGDTLLPNGAIINLLKNHEEQHDHQ